MYLEIVTPEAVVLKAEVDSVRVPGAKGEFQMLNHHAPIVSSLTKGEIKINLSSKSKEVLQDLNKGFTKDSSNSMVIYYMIKGGVLEMKGNNAIILAD